MALGTAARPSLFEAFEIAPHLKEVPQIRVPVQTVLRLTENAWSRGRIRLKWLAFLELKIDDFRDRRGLALALCWHLSHQQRSEIVWLKQAFKNPHFMATVLVMVDLLGLIAKYRDIATGSW